MTLSSKLIASAARSTYLLGSSSSSNGSDISALLRSPYNFGTKDYSTIKMHDLTYALVMLNNFDKSISASNISGMINGAGKGIKRNILLISYNAGLADQAAADTLTNYIQQGGVVVLLSSQILSTEKPSYLASNKEVMSVGAGNLSLMQNLFGPQVTKVLSTFNPGDAWKLPMAANNDRIFNGTFGDIRNQYVVTGTTVYPTDGNTSLVQGVVGVSYEGIPINKLDWVITATNYNADNVAISSNIVGFKASGYNFIWLADPGLFTYYKDYSGVLSTGTNCGLVSGTYKPVDLAPNSVGNSTKFTTVNSKFLANVLAWCMEQAEYNGINSK